MVKVSQALDNLFQARKTANNADLVERWSIEMETQTNSAQDEGKPVDGKRHTFTDGEYEWFSFRIPKNAASTPEFRDWNIRWPLCLHVEGVGMTGWKWTTRRSLWVAFDFDAIVGHAKGIGVPDEELERVKQAAMAWPGAEIRKSTGGAGIHIYVYFDGDGIPTENHTVHAALARCVLAMMSRDCGFDFASAIDCAGGNMWFWHRKMTPENEGLKIIKPAEEKLSESDLPSDWRDNIEVVAHRQAKVRVDTDVLDDHLDPFVELAFAHKRVPLDETHKAILDELSHSGFTTVWLPDRHLCQTHTMALKKLMETGQYEGVFETLSNGNNPGTPNCFWFPEEDGVLHVHRFSPGVKEAETWKQDGVNWTTCRFNWPPDLSKVASVVNAEEKSATTEARTDSSVTEPKQETLTMETNTDMPTTDAKKEEPLIKLISCKELDSNSFDLEYLIKDVLVARQPCVLGGPKKALKTSLLVDLAISLATTKPFLGQFTVNRPCEIVMLSGESGMATLQKTARRVCESKGVHLSSIENLNWCDFLPRFNNRKHLNELETVVKRKKCEVVIVDPAYLCMPGTDASNVQSQGTLLRAVNEVCHRNGAGIIIAHHTKKSAQRQNDHRPPDLDDLAWSGFPEFARQWLLLSRRKDYVPGTGEHELWLSIGGSAGHSALWAVDVDEGVPDLPRYWKVEIFSASEARAEKKATSLQQRIIEAMPQFPEGETKSGIVKVIGGRAGDEVNKALDALVRSGQLVKCHVKKKSATYEGFALATSA
ncbi:MAG: AAA family ATPase [Pirellulales bacterium]|nr:AAA family ATPase [Pirellulales bacterium]